MRLLVTGANGQVGRELVALARARGASLVAASRGTLDVTDTDAVRRAVLDARPDAVVNAAAYTAVDRAEEEPDAATAVNRDGAANVARACAEARIPLVHVSTDYVFDGTKGAPYIPSDSVAPLGVYGRTKAEGEAAVAQALTEHVILRTAWVFSAWGHNFVRTMLRLARERDEIRVVADQVGGPTSATAVARACYAIAEASASGQGIWGTFHYAGRPSASWADLAREAIRVGHDLDSDIDAAVVPIPTSAYPTPAARPTRVSLDTAAVTEAYGIEAPDWRADLVPVVRALVESERAGRA